MNSRNNFPKNRTDRSFLDARISRRGMLHRSIAAGLSLPALGGILAACGGDDDEEQSDDSVADLEEDTPTEAPEEEPEDEDPEPEDEPDPTPEETDDEPDEPDEPEEVEEEVDPEEAALPEGEPERPQSDQMAYGFNVAWRADEDGQEFNESTWQAVDTAGFNWIRFQIHWSEIQREPDWHDPAPVDRMVDVYEGTDAGIMVSIVGAPDWARHPENTQLLENWDTFGDIMAFLADRYRGRVHAWEIWNEQNMAHEMHGTVRVSDYAYMLAAGYQGVKDADPEALVVFGGLTPTGINDPEVAINDVDYLREFYTFEDGAFQGFFDVMGAHLNATNNPPDTSYPDNPGPGEWSDHSSFYFLRGVDLRQVMEEFGDQREMWVTEFGWTTENQAPGYEYGAEISEEDQANYLVSAFDVAREQMPWISGMFVWNLNFTTITPPEDEKYPWSVMNSDWSPRPAYNALQEMPKP
jgi:polysaccharide biosynthesis protein PslG